MECIRPIIIKDQETKQKQIIAISKMANLNISIKVNYKSFQIQINTMDNSKMNNITIINNPINTTMIIINNIIMVSSKLNNKINNNNSNKSQTQ